MRACVRRPVSQISEAYEVLSDDSKRQQYDQFGHIDPNGQGFPGGGAGFGAGGFGGTGFEDFFSGGGNPFNPFGTGQDEGRGEDVHVSSASGRARGAHRVRVRGRCNSS